MKSLRVLTHNVAIFRRD